MMYKDVVSIIGKYANINLQTYQYHCDKCNDKIEYDQTICCIYKNESDLCSTVNDNIDFFKKTINYKFKYICVECYDNIYKYLDSDLMFLSIAVLDLESIETLFYDTIKKQQEKKLKKCIFGNVSIEENNDNDDDDGWYKSLFTLHHFNDKTIIESCFLYENDIPFEKYFLGLHKSEQKIFEDFKVEEYINCFI